MKSSVWRKFLLFIAAVFVFSYLVAPFSWVVITSIMTERETLSVPPHWIPHNPTLKNYVLFVTGGKGGNAVADYGKSSPQWTPQSVTRFPVSFRNSVIVSISVVLLTLSMGAPAAYALARLRFRGSRLLLVAYISLSGIWDYLTRCQGLFSRILLSHCLLSSGSYEVTS
jgi:multiple sugar transport system permease protein